MAKKPSPRAKSATRAAGSAAYPEPTGGAINLGLNATSHNGSNYAQPNSANDPDPASTAPPGAAPGPAAYSPSLAGNTLPSSMGNPGVMGGSEPPNLPLSPSSKPVPPSG